MSKKNKEKEERPWGKYVVLHDSDDCKVKRITVKPGQRLSYQYHHKRSEIWTFVCGEGIVTLNDVDILVKEKTVVQIGMGDRHRVHNTGDKILEFIEVQLGSYFGEDDIVRLEDDFGRA